jgi:hypothetical protein
VELPEGAAAQPMRQRATPQPRLIQLRTGPDVVLTGCNRGDLTAENLHSGTTLEGTLTIAPQSMKTLHTGATVSPNRAIVPVCMLHAEHGSQYRPGNPAQPLPSAVFRTTGTITTQIRDVPSQSRHKCASKRTRRPPWARAGRQAHTPAAMGTSGPPSAHPAAMGDERAAKRTRPAAMGDERAATDGDRSAAAARGASDRCGSH